MNRILEKIQKIGIVPVVVLDDPKDAAPLAEALCKGGLPCAEVTFRTAAAEESIRIMTECFPGYAGRSGNRPDHRAGRPGPCCRRPLYRQPRLKSCRRSPLYGNRDPCNPGTATPSDVEAAMGLVWDVVKFFPAEQAGGIAMIKAMSAPYTQMKFMPTGGVNAQI